MTLTPSSTACAAGALGRGLIEYWRHAFITPPFQHQAEDAARLIDQPEFGLLSEMGTGKTKTVIDAACILFKQGELDAVVIVAPAAVRSVWFNPEFGELRKHAWVPSFVCEYHQKNKTWSIDPDQKMLEWCITNYEFVRDSRRLAELTKIMHGKRFMLVLDESAKIKSRSAQCTKAMIKFGQLAARRVILNGTPIANNPLDMWSQMLFLNRRILPYDNYSQFRAEFAIMDHRVTAFPKIIGWRNLEVLQAQCAPYVVRREKKDCLDLPEKVYTQVEVPLKDETWAIYKKMRDEAIVFMEEHPSMAAEAGVLAMRLRQITSGFLGGFESDNAKIWSSIQEAQAKGKEISVADVLRVGNHTIKEVGSEKIDYLREWVTELLAERPTRKIIVWCEFRAEVERIVRELADIVPTFKLYGQGRAERDEVVAYFSSRDDRPGLMSGIPAAGGWGLNLVGADAVAYISGDFNLMTRLQSEDRVHRPGQINKVLYLDIVATGPKGQKTIDHHRLKSVRAKHDIATWTVDAWRKTLED